MTWKTLPFCLALVIALTLLGCGPSGPRKHPVSGTATYAGKPIEEGNITFINMDHKEWGPDGAVIKNGKFTLQVKEGKARVEITGSRPVTDPEILAKAGGPPPYEDYIPAKHNTGSTRIVEITAPMENLEIHLDR